MKVVWQSLLIKLLSLKKYFSHPISSKWLHPIESWGGKGCNKMWSKKNNKGCNKPYDQQGNKRDAMLAADDP